MTNDMFTVEAELTYDAATDTLTAPSTQSFGEGALFVVTITHQFGHNITVHRTEEGAFREVHGFVRDWWTDECQDELGDMPDDRMEAIGAYFVHREPEESYDITVTALFD